VRSQPAPRNYQQHHKDKKAVNGLPEPPGHHGRCKQDIYKRAFELVGKNTQQARWLTLGQRIETVLKQAFRRLSGAYSLLFSVFTHHVVMPRERVIPLYNGRLVIVIGEKTRMS
jgi:hypothetical protein